MESIGLVLEGGGMRGVYTAGVLEYFAEQDLYLPYTIGVSAGACNAVSYLSRQKGRNYRINIEMIKDPRYLSWRNMWTKRQLFGMDFIFDVIPNSLIPFDYKSFYAATEKFVVGTTDCETGQPVYFDKCQSDFDASNILRASSSLPFIAPIVEYKGMKLMDGGIADPIPIRKAELDGCKRNVLLLTRNKGYMKKPNRFPWLLNRNYGQYPSFVAAMLRRHKVYNDTLAYIEQQERNGSAFIIQPQEPLTVGRLERNPEKLRKLYQQGYEDAKKQYPSLMEWIHR